MTSNKRFKGKFNTSIRTKISFMLVTFALFVICAAWITSNFFVEGFFIMNMQNNMEITFDSCNEIFSSEEQVHFNENFYRRLKNPGDAMVLIFDKTNNNIYTSVSVDEEMVKSINALLLSIEMAGDSYVNQPGNYVFKRNHDSMLDANYLDLIGTLDNGSMIIVRSSITRLEGTMRVLNKIFVWVAIVLVVFGTGFMLVFSKIFVTPIKKLSVAAKKMAELDFSVKLPVYSKDEIGELSTHMNEMSETLESTISRLKSANAMLEHDIEKREQTDDMRKEFLSHVSHELKTPIALIQGYAEGLKDNIFDDEESRKYYTDVIIDEAQKMNTLVKKLLTLNEIEFGETPLKIERFELVEFVDQVINATKILTDDNNATIIFEEKSPVYVWADEYMIEEVFTNYLTNAIHYVNPDGLIKVFFETKGSDIRVNVYNQGNNISEEDIDKLFEKFYKVDKARTREYGGSGIGLSIVAATMKAHGKDYGVYNVEDGVVFYFDLDANMPC